MGRIEKWIGESLFISEEPKQSLLAQCRKSKVDFEATVRQTDLTGVMEGIYIKVEDGDYVTDRLKYVRGSFLNTILDSESHWVNRPIVANVLADGVDLFDMQEGAGTDGGKDSGGNS